MVPLRKLVEICFRRCNSAKQHQTATLVIIKPRGLHAGIVGHIEACTVILLTIVPEVKSQQQQGPIRPHSATVVSPRLC